MRDACLRAEAALSSDIATAARWLDRARRLAAADPASLLACARVALRLGDGAAARDLFARVLAAHDLRDAHLGLAAANHLLGEQPAAAGALAAAFCRHAGPLDPEARALATASAAEAGQPGWCAALPDRRLFVAVGGKRQPRFRLEGRPIRLRRVAPGTYEIPPALYRAENLDVDVDGASLFGSPIHPSAIRRIDGFAMLAGNELAGLAWYPNDAESDPELTIRLPRRERGRAPQPAGAPGGRSFIVRATACPTPETDALPPFARPRRFAVDIAHLLASAGERDVASALPAALPVTVTSAEGETLLGCPVDVTAEQRAALAAARGVLARRPPGRQSGEHATPTRLSLPADIVGDPGSRHAAAPVPQSPVCLVVLLASHERPDATLVDSIASGLGAGLQVLVVDAGGQREAAETARLDAMTHGASVALIRLKRRASLADGVNAAIGHTSTADLLLLPPGLRLTPGSAERMAEIAQTATDIGTISPLIIDAPWEGGVGTTTSRPTVDIGLPASECLLIRRACIDQVGMLRAALFGEAPGAIGDFCVRARHLGWRHVLATGAHAIEAPPEPVARPPLIGPAALATRNAALLRRLHPGIDAIREPDPAAAQAMADARRHIDVQRWRAAEDGRPCVVLISHDRGGGVERVVRRRCQALRDEGRRPVVMRPSPRARGGVGCQVGDGGAGGYPGLVYAPHEFTKLVELVGIGRVEMVEFHHAHGHDPAIFAVPFLFAAPVDVFVHDYISFCPRIALVGAGRQYCGEPALRHCEACVADCGAVIEEDITVSALRARSASLFVRARRVVAPSRDAAARITRHFPRVVPEVIAWEGDAAFAGDARRPGERDPTADLRVAVIGAIGLHKGYDVLLACAREAARSGVNLFFTVIGHTIDDERLIATGRVFVTGPYEEGEAERLIRSNRNDVALLPSIWPETWCFTLTEAWRAGLSVVAFDIGAQAERIRRTERGMLLPLGATPKSVNNALLALAGETRHE